MTTKKSSQKTLLTDKIVTGKRKTSIARLRIYAGTGKFLINGKDALAYFGLPRLVHNIKKPMAVLGENDQYDVTARLNGGGISGQADALRHAIARALVLIHPNKKKILKDFHFITRDARKVQRKMFGHKKARKSFQFSKR